LFGHWGGERSGEDFKKNKIMYNENDPTLGIEKKEEIQPEIIIDLIRHGQTIYSQEFKNAVETIGYKFEDLFKDSKLVDSQDEGGFFEGEITPEGEQKLRESIKELVGSIDQNKEKIMCLYSERHRTCHSAEIIIDELKNNNVKDIYKFREQKDLIDIETPVINILKYIKEHDKTNASSPWPYWFGMSEKELSEAGVDSINGIKTRMNHILELLERYARRYGDKLGLGDKKLRVIAVTHDVNIISLLEKFNIPKEEIKNARVFELVKNKEGEFSPVKK